MVPHIWNHSPLIKPVVITAQNAVFDNINPEARENIFVVITAQNAGFDNHHRAFNILLAVVITAQNAVFNNYTQHYREWLML